MSSLYSVPSDVFENKDLSSSSKLTFCLLFTRKTDDDGVIKISHEKIAEILNLSRLTVRDALLQLIEFGFISSTRDDRGWFTYKIED